MGNSRIKITPEIAVILVLSMLLGFMIFSFGMEIGREYYDLTHP